MRPIFTWNLGSRSLELGKRTLVMGIVNVTPDSFSDGGEHLTFDAAVAHALKLLDEGADIIDIGGESTRPGARVGAENPAVSAQEELQRVLPVITEVKKARSSAIISIDTYKAAVARAAVGAGAEIVNDVSGFLWDPQMAKTVAEMKCGAVLMHMRGRPEQWRTLPPPGDVVLLVKRELKQWAEAAVLAGVRRERIVLDPGFGFGTTPEQNLEILRRLGELRSLGLPLLVGPSRKSTIGRVLGLPVEERIEGTAALVALSIASGSANRTS